MNNSFLNTINLSFFSPIVKSYETIQDPNVSLAGSCDLSSSYYFTEINSMLPLLDLMTENCQSSVVVSILCNSLLLCIRVLFQEKLSEPELQLSHTATVEIIGEMQEEERNN